MKAVDFNVLRFNLVKVSQRMREKEKFVIDDSAQFRLSTFCTEMFVMHYTVPNTHTHTRTSQRVYNHLLVNESNVICVVFASQQLTSCQ